MAVQSKYRAFVVVCIVAVAGIVASVVWRHPAPAVELSTGMLLTPSRELPDFSLIDQQGKVFGSANLRGRWSLLFFGYTNCPDFCPTTLTMLAAMQKRLRAATAPVLPQVIFVSVDAKRDTPALLAKYVPNFDPEFIGLTAADQPGIEAIAKQFGVSVILRPASGGDYTIDHSAEIFVLAPDGRLRAILSGPFSVDALQSDFERIVGARGILAGRA
jgi:protein SCO1/2